MIPFVTFQRTCVCQDDGSPVSVFEFDTNSNPSKRNLYPIANNAMKKLRTTRHPDVLKFIDAVATDTTIYVMTERVRPLSSVLNNWSTKTSQEREDWLIWGLHRISVRRCGLPCIICINYGPTGSVVVSE